MRKLFEVTVLGVLMMDIFLVGVILSFVLIPAQKNPIRSQGQPVNTAQGQSAFFNLDKLMSQVLPDLSQGQNADQDKFPVIAEADLNAMMNQEDIAMGQVEAKAMDADMVYTPVSIFLPLQKVDYYYRKFENGRAGANELNNMPILKPGTRISVIGNGYLTLSPRKGYVQPPGYYFGSGLCWSTSALGGLMDKANVKFQAKYGMPLFIFNRGDRAPHPHIYPTYSASNGGKGYTVLKAAKGGQDYRFTVNPAIKNIPGMANLKINIIMTTSTNFAGAYKGYEIGAYIQSNKNF